MLRSVYKYKIHLGLRKAYSSLGLIISLIVCFSTHLNAQNDSFPKDKITFDNNQPDNSVVELIGYARDNFDNNTKTAFNYISEALNYEEQIKDSSKIKLYTAAGELYYNLSLYDISLDYFYKALELQNQKDHSFNYNIWNSIGNVHFILGDFEKARIFYQLAKEQLETIGSVEKQVKDKRHTVYNNLAVLEIKEKNFLAAKTQLLYNLKLDEAMHDSISMVRTYHNLANVHIDLDEIPEAFSCLNKGIEICKIINDEKGLAFLLVNKGFYYSENKLNIDSAIHFSRLGFNMGLSLGYPYVQKESAETLYDIYKSIGDYDQALYYHEINKKLSEEALNADNIKKITSIELIYKHEQIKRELLEKQRKNELILYSIIIISLLLIFLFIMLFRLQKGKAIKQKLQNDVLKEKLHAKNKEFTAKVMHTLQITEILNNTYTELSEIQKGNQEELSSKLSSVRAKLKNEHLNFNWEEFEKLFVEMHEGFYTKLLTNHPNLSKNELRLCAFLKMNLSSKEISAITNQSYRSIVMARSRLRKKLGIDTEQQSITSFLAHY